MILATRTMLRSNCHQTNHQLSMMGLLFHATTWITILISNIFVSSLENSHSLACTSGIKTFDPHRHKKKYVVGVHAIRGFETAIQEYEKTYGEYLSATAGRRFDQPIEFEMVPMTFEGIFDAADNEGLDFFYANPSIFSCVGTEVGAQPLATIISRLEVRGRTFDLDVFGGVIATHRDNDEINTIEDLKDKIIGAGSISMLMAAQLQFHEMERAGMSYVMDPKQVVFTGNQFDVVNGVIDGEFDVGFVRTDQIERTVDSDGVTINPELLKIIEPKIHILDDGNLFPFLHSTPIYPEWPLAALTHVPQDVAKEVQNALLAVGEHAHVGKLYEECIAQSGFETCENFAFPTHFDPGARCDTSKEIAQLAWEASQVGKWAGFRTTRSYFELRSMQETAGFISKDEKGNWKCTRASSLYDGIRCPPGHFKIHRDAFEDGCNQMGLPCKQGYDCFCRPCVKAFEIDIYEYTCGEGDSRLTDPYFGEAKSGCDKMSVCGTVEQTKTLTLRAYDNKERDDINITGNLRIAEKVESLSVVRIQNTFAYEFNISSDKVGFDIIEIFINGEQIKESPILVKVVERNCDTDFNGESRVPDSTGICVCRHSAMEVGGRCISSAIVFTLIAIVVALIALQVGYLFLSHKRRQADSMWLVNIDELHFSEPVDIIGQGSFGVVLLAEYRGTKVAVKRVLPPRETQKGGSGSDGRSCMDDSNEDAKDEPDLEAQNEPKEISSSEENLGTSSMDSWSLDLGSTPSGFAKWFPKWFDKRDYSAKTDNILGSRSVGTSNTMASWCSYCDEHAQQKRDFIVEMRLLSRLRHPGITTVMGAIIAPATDPMLVMEYMEYGSLYDLLRNETMYTGGEVILQIVRDITQGLRYLHASKPPILHGDLKAKNILIDSRFRAKVCDFGLSTKISHGIHGTPYWMAPEYLKRETEYNAQCDMYSLGMVFYEIYARSNPYEGENPRRILRQVCDPKINKRPDIPETCPPKMTDIMKKCWSLDAFFRPTAKDLDLIFMDTNIQDVEPLEKEQQGLKHLRNERPTKEVLYEVFPKHIADSLNAGKKVEPESHEMVTVVFSDIVGFTTISREISPLKVSNMLDRLYLAFDKLARKHEVFKVETIGDAYMGVTNLNGSQQDDHAKRIAEFGLDLVEAAGKIIIDEEDPSKGFIHIRVGLHSGPVVSNVIGSLNPRYGLFGDTVNTASRMETNSSAERILCSQRTASLLKKQAPNIPVIKRGKISVKGKGDMVTYWVGDSRDDVIVDSNRGTHGEKYVAVGLKEAEVDIARKKTLENYENVTDGDKTEVQFTIAKESTTCPTTVPSGLEEAKTLIGEERMVRTDKNKTFVDQTEGQSSIAKEPDTYPKTIPFGLEEATPIGEKATVEADENLNAVDESEGQCLIAKESNTCPKTIPFGLEEAKTPSCDKGTVETDKYEIEGQSSIAKEFNTFRTTIPFGVEESNTPICDKRTVESDSSIVVEEQAEGQGSISKVSDACSTSIHIPNKISEVSVLTPKKEDAGHVKTEQLVEWIVEILLRQIKKIIALRSATAPMSKNLHGCVTYATPKNVTCLEEVKNVINMPKLNSVSSDAIAKHRPIEISPIVLAQLKEFVSLISYAYRANKFHNFRHSCHAIFSMQRLLQALLDRNLQSELETTSWEMHSSRVHDVSYGIASDPMTLFALLFSTLIHDVDHRGVSNMQLIKEEPCLASRYRNRSVAEQNSIDIAWEILMCTQFDELRRCIFGTGEELLRFRQLVVNIVMATDIFDKQSYDLRKERWDRAFRTKSLNKTAKQEEELNDFRASVVIEHMIQASDVSHTMQHWPIYLHWNRRLFQEMHIAYRQGRLDANPSTFWYQCELGFFDNYVIPLAKRLKECNCFGESSDECLYYAVSNRARWALCGHDIINEMVKKIHQKEEKNEEKKDELICTLTSLIL